MVQLSTSNLKEWMATCYEPTSEHGTGWRGHWPTLSTMGQRSSWNDPRAQVFSKVNDIIIDQGHKGAYFFILELVDGMDTHRKNRHDDCDQLRHLPEVTPYTAWLSDLSRRAPMWEVHV